MLPPQLLAGLIKTMCETGDPESTDRRDRMFEKLGVNTDGVRLTTAPTYDKRLEDLFQQMTFAYIRLHASLDIICLRGAEPNTELKAPSWVADWLSLCPPVAEDQPKADDSLDEWRASQYVFRDGQGSISTVRSQWDATKGSRAGHYQVQQDGALLRVRGQYLTDVSYVGQRYGVLGHESMFNYYAPILGRSGSSTTKGAEESLSVLNLAQARWTTATSRRQQTNPYGSESGAVKALRETMTMCADPTYRTIGNNYIEMLWQHSSLKLLEHLDPRARNWLFDNASFPIQGKRLEDWALRNKEWSADGSAAWRFSNPSKVFQRWSRAVSIGSSSNAADDRMHPEFRHFVQDALVKTLAMKMRIMSSEDGYVGWAHPLALPKDKVFLLHGCSMPVILRPYDNQRNAYHVVGDAYVYGAMNGQCWDVTKLTDIALV